MRKIPFSAAFAAIAILLAACNNVGDCPASSEIVQGGSCSGDSLACPYTLQSLSPMCDGTTVDGGIATSCVCTKGTWICPSPVSCSDGGEGGTLEVGDAAGEASDVAAEADDAAGDANDAAGESSDAAGVDAAGG
jgi:hypothetical protein